jgi:5-methylcytosine-specific restriction endonuclease McrA
MVCACKECNSRKANKTPKEAGIKLRSIPTKPKWYALHARLNGKCPESWKKFFPDI